MNDSLPLFDAAQASAAKQNGMDLACARSGDFSEQVLAAISTMNGEVQGEDIRKHCLERAIEPRSSKAWGAVISKAIKRGLLVPTGRYERTTSVRTHAHPTQVYRIASA